ncbi:MAG: photosystem II reaction center protein Psb28 [Synechocystis sp.]|nr:photosystem II reaction center protein Psb28 [Synechocystis sp.]
MSAIAPHIEFFEGLPETLSNVSLRRGKTSNNRSVLFTFQTLKALEKFQSFTKQFTGNLKLVDEEGTISVEPSSLRIIWGGDEGDDLRGVECGFELLQDDHWDRFMRFMERYAAANGMEYQSKKA